MSLRLVNGQIVDTDKPKVNVRFYEHAKKVGIGKFVPVDFVEIRAVGVRDFMSRPVKDEDKKLYPDEWAAYQSGKAQEDARTTPLTALPAHKAYFGLQLNSMGIHTVEELSFCDECPVEGAELLWKQAKKYVLLLEDDDGDEAVPAKSGSEGKSDNDLHGSSVGVHSEGSGFGQDGLAGSVREETEEVPQAGGAF